MLPIRKSFLTKYRPLFECLFDGSQLPTDKFTITDTESKLSLNGAGQLSCSGGKDTPAGGDPGLVSKTSFPRTQGLTCEFELKPTANNLYCAAGFSDGSIPDTLNDIAFGYFGNTGYVRATNVNNILLPFAYSAGVSYYWRIVVLPVGYLFYISTDRYTWYMVWKYEAGITATLYAAYGGYNNPFTSDFMRVYAGTAKTPIIDALAATPTLAYGDEKITDGALENWTSATNLTSWVEVLAGTSTVNQETSVIHGGSNALRLDIDASGNAAYIQQVMTLALGQWVSVTGWMKSNPTAKGIRVDLGTMAGSTQSLTGTYVQYFWTFRVTETNPNVYVIRGFGVSASSSLYADDLSLKVLTLANMLTGGGDAGTKYGVFDADVTATTGTQAGLVTALDSATTPLNYLQAYIGLNDNKAYLLKVVNGTTTDLTSGNITYSAGNKLRIVVSPGSSGLSNAGVGLYYNSVIVGTVQTVDLSSGFGNLVKAFDPSGAATVDLEVNV